MKQDNILSMIGLAKKSGNVVSGEFSTENAIKDGKAFLVIVADNASDNTKKLFRNKCEFYKVPIAFCFSKDELGKSMGLQMRTSLAITDEGFANAIIKKLAERNISITN